MTKIMALKSALAVTATAAAVDPEPASKTVLAGVVVAIGTTLVTCIVAEGISRTFKWMFD